MELGPFVAAFSMGKRFFLSVLSGAAIWGRYNATHIRKGCDGDMRSSTNTRDVALSVVLAAIAVALSPIFIPVGIAKCFPAQHMVNVMAGVMLGPIYAVIIAAVSAFIRNIMGLGTFLAFPGGMIGAFLAGLAYRQFKNIYAAGAGEVIGTGFLGALASVWIVAPIFVGKSMALATLILAFSVSTMGGTVFGIIALHLLRKAGIWKP